jgi:hypothetical protein
MKIAKHDLIAALRLRYDHYSATSVFDTAVARAGLADQADYDAQQVDQFLVALRRVGDRLVNVENRIASLLGTTPAADSGATPETRSDARSGANDGVKSDAKANAKVDTKSDAKVDTKADAKSDAKADAKPDMKSDTKAEAKADGKADAKADVKAADAKVIETTISLAGVPAGDGEQILVCGASALLGEWNPENAPAMKRDGDTWLAIVKVPPDIDLAFKFLRRTPDGKVIWEGGDDRKLVAKPRIDATWRSA